MPREVPLIRALAFSQRLAGTAAQLLGAKRLRLYQDCVFAKEPGFSATNWHSDASLSPLDTNAFVTAWIPLRPIMVRAPRYPVADRLVSMSLSPGAACCRRRPELAPSGVHAGLR